MWQSDPLFERKYTHLEFVEEHGDVRRIKDHSEAVHGRQAGAVAGRQPVVPPRLLPGDRLQGLRVGLVPKRFSPQGPLHGVVVALHHIHLFSLLGAKEGKGAIVSGSSKI